MLNNINLENTAHRFVISFVIECIIFLIVTIALYQGIKINDAINVSMSISLSNLSIKERSQSKTQSKTQPNKIKNEEITEPTSQQTARAKTENTQLQKDIKTQNFDDKELNNIISSNTVDKEENIETEEEYTPPPNANEIGGPPVTQASFEYDSTQNPSPKFPLVSKQLGEFGTVVLIVEVLANGEVGEVYIDKTSGYERLDNAVLYAVKTWKFTPALDSSGRQVSSYLKIPFEFPKNSNLVKRVI